MASPRNSARLASGAAGVMATGRNTLDRAAMGRVVAALRAGKTAAQAAAAAGVSRDAAYTYLALARAEGVDLDRAILPVPATRDAGSDWRHRAACREDVDPELFFPEGEAGPVVEAQVAAAKAVCTRCPVRLECRDWAVEAGLAGGVFGGLDEGERRALKRAQVRARVRTA